MKRTDFHGLLKALSEGGVDFVMVGGVAEVLSTLGGRYRDPDGRIIEPTVQRLRESRVNLLTTDLGLLDGMQVIGDGWRFGDLQPKSAWVRVGDLDVPVLGLEAVIESKRAAGREKDRAMLPVLLRTLEERGEE